MTKNFYDSDRCPSVGHPQKTSNRGRRCREVQALLREQENSWNERRTDREAASFRAKLRSRLPCLRLTPSQSSPAFVSLRSSQAGEVRLPLEAFPAQVRAQRKRWTWHRRCASPQDDT